MPQLNTRTELQPEYKESNPSSLDMESGCVLTEVYYTTEICPKPTRKELYNMGNEEKISLWKNRYQEIMFLENEGTKRENCHLKKSYPP